jgi:hypothetical protein
LASDLFGISDRQDFPERLSSRAGRARRDIGAERQLLCPTRKTQGTAKPFDFIKWQFRGRGRERGRECIGHQLLEPREKIFEKVAKIPPGELQECTVMVKLADESEINEKR